MDTIAKPQCETDGIIPEDVHVVDKTELLEAVVERLQYMIAVLNGSNGTMILPVEDFKAKLEFAVKVLINCYVDEQRCFKEEVNGLPDMPMEVRDWLLSTFARNLNAAKDRNEKPKLRSIANAIRSVARMRSMSLFQPIDFPPEVLVHLQTISEWTFDVFALDEASEGQALRYVASKLLNHYDLLKKFKISRLTLDNFLIAVEAGCNKYNNPYHNLVHAADVTQTMHWFLCQTHLARWLSDVQILAGLIGAMTHDYEHTGTTNNFHVRTRSPLATLYNDRSVLENHHLSATFELMQKNDHNILSNLTEEQYREFRSLVIDMVLATDMSMHFKLMKSIKANLSTPENIDKSDTMQMILHSCDIGHPAKPWSIHHRFTMRVTEEFFQQGDREEQLGLPFSPLCDRKTTLIPQSQIAFIDFIVEPCMLLAGEMLDKILEPLQEDDHVQDGTGTVSSHNGSGDETEDSMEYPHASKIKSHPIKKPWISDLAENKAKWREVASQGQMCIYVGAKPL